MFALPLTARLHDTLASHVFGRPVPPLAPPGHGGLAGAPQALGAEAAAPEDEVPDLAQRVREVGEW